MRYNNLPKVAVCSLLPLFPKQIELPVHHPTKVAVKNILTTNVLFLAICIRRAVQIIVRIFLILLYLAIRRPSGCIVASGVVVVVVVGVCNRSQMRTSKCTRLIFDVSIETRERNF